MSPFTRALAEVDRALATRAACSRALATEISGSTPEPDDVTASTGTLALGGQAVEPCGRRPPAATPGCRKVELLGP